MAAREDDEAASSQTKAMGMKYCGKASHLLLSDDYWGLQS
jgi:hypothetical protein